MRRTSEQIRIELENLCACFDVIQDCMFNRPGFVVTSSLGSGYKSFERMLKVVEKKEVTLSQALAGMREGLNDTSEQLTHWLEDYPDLASDALEKYRQRTGRNYWDDAGHPKKLVKQVLRRGRVRDETEFRLLTGVLSDLAQKILTPEEVERAQSLLSSFEERARS